MNVAALTAAIRRQTAVDSTVGQVTDATILIIINEGLNTVSSLHRWPWLLKGPTNLNVTANTVQYDLAATAWAVHSVVRSGKSRRLNEISFENYLDIVGNNPSTSTEATAYYIRPDTATPTTLEIGLYPTPSANATAAYQYYHYQTATELTTGSPEWHAQFHHILVDYGAYRLWEREEYFDESAKAYLRFTRTLKDMIRFYNMQSMEATLIYGDGNHTTMWDNRLHLPIW